MMTVKGFKLIDYTNKDGKHVRGIRIGYEFEATGYIGKAVAEDYIGGKAFAEMEAQGMIPAVGDGIEFVYGRARDGKAYVTGWRLFPAAGC